MDPIVEAALRKWPGVPHCYGWLALDARGDWYLRDEPAQAAGAFPAAKGSRIEHAGLLGFINRNYAHDADGCWFFQNGPQRVYVDLEAAPWVWRLDRRGDAPDALTLHAHTGAPAVWRSTWLDERGRVFIDADIGFGLVHTQDTGLAAQAIESGTWTIAGELPHADLPERFGYVRQPRAR